MGEQEKYKQMMNEIHVSETILRKVMEMDMSKKMLNRKRMMKKVGTIAAALTLCIVASNGICYAATGHSWVTKAIISVNGEEYEQEFIYEEQADGTFSYTVNSDLFEDKDLEGEEIYLKIEDSDGYGYTIDINDSDVSAED